jgi:hypothetical protein
MKQEKDYAFQIIVFLVLLVIATTSCSRYTAVGPDGGCMFKKRTNYRNYQMERIIRL